MKLILKDKQEIEISNTNINYNTNLSEDERRSITFVLDEPTIATDELIDMLTRDNLGTIQIVSAAKTVEKQNLKLITVSESITDDHYRIEIRLSTK